MKSSALLTLSLLYCLVTQAAFAASQNSNSDIDKAIASLQQQDYITSLKLLTPIAEDGEARAQALLGHLYAEGLGVAQDQQQAVYWYELAAMQGLAEVQFDLGNFYLNGDGVKADARKTFQWWRKAAQQGLPEAQYNLGLLYQQGIGVSQNSSQAKQWINKAATNGLPVAQDKSTINKPSVQLPVVSSQTIYREDWIHAQAYNTYTLQLSSGFNEKAIIRFIERYRNDQEGAYFEDKSADGKSRYTAIVGVYHSFEVAKQALAALPDSVTRFQPWVRRFGSLQNQITPKESQ